MLLDDSVSAPLGRGPQAGPADAVGNCTCYRYRSADAANMQRQFKEAKRSWWRRWSGRIRAGTAEHPVIQLGILPVHAGSGELVAEPLAGRVAHAAAVVVVVEQAGEILG